MATVLASLWTAKATAAYQTTLAAMPGGEVLIAWEGQYKDTDGVARPVIKYAALDMDGGEIHAVHDVSAKNRNTAENPQFVITPDGRATLTYNTEVYSIDNVLYPEIHANASISEYGFEINGYFYTGTGAQYNSTGSFYLVSFEDGPAWVTTSFFLTKTDTPDGGSKYVISDLYAQSEYAVSLEAPALRAVWVRGEDFLVAYQAEIPGVEGTNVYVLPYSSSYESLPKPIQVNFGEGSARISGTADGKDGFQSLARLKNGDVVIVWTEDETWEWGVDLPFAMSSAVFGRIMAPDGTWRSDPFDLSEIQTGDQKDVTICALEDGGFAIAYTGPDGLNMRAFDPDGMPRGSELLVAPKNSASYSIAESPDGSILVSFTKNHTDVEILRVDLARSRIGTNGNDTLDGARNGQDTRDVLNGYAGDDRIFGHDGDDRLFGGDGNDRLDGGAGADDMRGGRGDDTYVVRDYTDSVIEAAGQGTDRVEAWTDVVLSENVENLRMMGDANLWASGNAFKNIMIGNRGDNRLDGRGGADDMRGGTGNDSYVVDDKNDRIVEGATEGAVDRVEAWVSYVLPTNVENMRLMGAASINGTGNASKNVIFGNDGNNRLDGRAGADDLRGFRGDDTYVVDHRSDRVTEAAGQGTDTIETTISFTLSANVEILRLRGAAAIDGTGNSGVNTLVGNNAANVLDGREGADILTGGRGADVFSFSTALGRNNIDRITDFYAPNDTIRLDDAIFTSLAKGQLQASAFAARADATTAFDRILYDKASGALFYDADGLNGVAKVQFAQLAANTALSAADFVVI